MLHVQGNDLEKLGQETDPEKDLRGPAHAPVEQLDQRHEPVGLKHVVFVFSQRTEDRYDFDAEFNGFSEVLELRFGTQEDPLANVNEGGDELQFAE